MSSSHNTGPDEKNPLPTAAALKDPNGQIADKIVIPDECGDSLWDEVLAQHPELTTIIHKPAGADADKGNSNLQS